LEGAISPPTQVPEDRCSGQRLVRPRGTADQVSPSAAAVPPDPRVDGDRRPTGRSLHDADRDIVLGHEFVGKGVIALGPGCGDQFPIGTRVTSMRVRFAGAGTWTARSATVPRCDRQSPCRVRQSVPLRVLPTEQPARASSASQVSHRPGRASSGRSGARATVSDP